MAYGYGRVAISTFIGFLAGLYFQYEQPANSASLNYVGYLLLVVGIIGMVTNRKTITGIPGGFLTGLGLGITLASEPGFASSLSSFTSTFTQ
jgi:hypothetical protein